MNVLFVVFPLALVLSSFAVVAFLWAVRRGQFDDLTTPALRVLTDDADARHASRPSPAESPARGSAPLE